MGLPKLPVDGPATLVNEGLEMSVWGVSTDAKCWRTVEVEADTLEEALALAVADSQAWAEEQDINVQFGSWRDGEAFEITSGKGSYDES